MSSELNAADGGCLCGAIRFRATGPEVGAGYCHCESCRRQTGAPIAAFVVFDAERVLWIKGDRERYESSPARFRSFCGTCGASLAFEDHSGTKVLVEFHISSLDRPDKFPPNEHTHYAERLSWLNISDDLPKYEGSMHVG